MTICFPTADAEFRRRFFIVISFDLFVSFCYSWIVCVLHVHLMRPVYMHSILLPNILYTPFDIKPPEITSAKRKHDKQLFNTIMLMDFEYSLISSLFLMSVHICKLFVISITNSFTIILGRLQRNRVVKNERRPNDVVYEKCVRLYVSTNQIHFISFKYI